MLWCLISVSGVVAVGGGGVAVGRGVVNGGMVDHGGVMDGVAVSKACMNPDSEYNGTQPIYTILMLDQVFYLLYTIIVFYSNIYLYRFLKTQTENNTALKETDQKKNRKRNFVPASFGMIHVSFYLVSYLGYVKLLRTEPMLDTARLEHLKQH